ncbi:sun [Metarhizium robertsii ARSEF 23]|uniref:Sun n=1 Tax=Metarhizium robertsii (strain ARSEF 23 / ATCC MYA-3075) TaxID=655844 RepID=A0A0B2X904_METRA|nr:sun [Metarhizium robertsii ARSEF 23]KHO11378.1 sun [Metarhizium robertsii ARSEF 23]
MSSENTGFPSLQPAFTIKHTPIGTIKSLPGFKPKVDAEIMFGGDWLYFDTDKSRTRINFKVITKTKSGAPFSFYYAGIVTIDEAIGKTFAYSPDSNTIPFGNSSGCNIHRLL